MIRTELVSMQEAAGETLPSLIDRAARALSSARTSAEVLEARDMAAFAYDAAKRAARLAQAKGAHDKLIAAAHRAQADALLIESQAKRRLADEYDAAQERGEVRSRGGDQSSHTGKFAIEDIGLTDKAMHEARQFQRAEVREPGIAERAVAAMLARGEEPTRAELKRAIEPKDYWNERAEQDAKERKDASDLKSFQKLWRSMSATCRANAREWLAAQK